MPGYSEVVALLLIIDHRLMRFCVPSHRIVVFGGAPLRRVIVVLRGLRLSFLLLSNLDDDFPGGEKNTNNSNLSRV